MLSILILNAIHFLYGLYFWSSEIIVSDFFKGNITDAPLSGFWFKDYLFFQVPLITFLISNFQHIPIYGILHLLLLIVYLSLWLHLILRVVERTVKEHSFYTVILSSVFLLSVIGESLIHIYSVQCSILYVSVSLLLYLDYYEYSENRPIFLVILLIYSFLLRVSITIIVLTAFTVFLGLHFRSIKKVFRFLILPWGVALFLLLMVEGYKIMYYNPSMKIEQRYEYALTDRNAWLPLSNMKTKEDSVRYNALIRYFLVSDSTQIGVKFIERVIDFTKWEKIIISEDDVTHFYVKSFPIIQGYTTYILLFYILCILLAWRCPKERIIIAILFNVFCWFVVLLLGLKIVLQEYFLISWMSMLFSFTIWTLLYKRQISFLQKVCISIIVLKLFLLKTEAINNIAIEEKKNNANTISYLSHIEQLSKTSTPIIWTYDWSFIPTEIFSTTESKVLQKCLYPNISFFAYYEFAQKRCIKKFNFNPLDWKTMGISLKKNKKEVVFITTPEFASFIEEYYRVLYHINFKIKKVYPENEIIPKHFVFELVDE